jgi:hypothetical protein
MNEIYWHLCSPGVKIRGMSCVVLPCEGYDYADWDSPHDGFTPGGGLPSIYSI